MTADLAAVVLRALGFVGLFQAAGAVLFASTFQGLGDLVGTRIRRLAVICAVAAIVCFIAQQSFEAARFAGELAGIFNPEFLGLAWNSPGGRAQIVRLAGLSLILYGFARAAPGSSILANVGAALALLSFLLSGHTSVHPLRVLLAPLLALHVLVVAFWFGSLLPLQLVSRHGSIAQATVVLQRFSVIAGWLVPLILAAGLAMIFVLAPDLSVLERPYGQIVLWKLAGFGLLMLLATYNRWRLVPAMATRGVVAAGALRRSIAIEVFLITAILGLTAVLTLFFSPED
jgi:putative copper export protein